jgi:hypothetical protein
MGMMGAAMIVPALCLGSTMLLVAVVCIQVSYCVAGRLARRIAQRIFKCSVTITESQVGLHRARKIQFFDGDQP